MNGSRFSQLNEKTHEMKTNEYERYSDLSMIHFVTIVHKNRWQGHQWGRNDQARLDPKRSWPVVRQYVRFDGQPRSARHGSRTSFAPRGDVRRHRFQTYGHGDPRRACASGMLERFARIGRATREYGKRSTQREINA
jgi:hypothetical protein